MRTREAAASVAREGGGGACSKTNSSKCFSFSATPYVPPVSCVLPQSFAGHSSNTSDSGLIGTVCGVWQIAQRNGVAIEEGSRSALRQVVGRSKAAAIGTVYGHDADGASCGAGHRCQLT